MFLKFCLYVAVLVYLQLKMWICLFTKHVLFKIEKYSSFPEDSIVVYVNMEKKYFNYLLKIIPVPWRTSYKLQLIDKIESVMQLMRRKAHFFSNNNEKKEEAKLETFGFKSKHYPGQLRELEHSKKFHLCLKEKFELPQSKRIA